MTAFDLNLYIFIGAVLVFGCYAIITARKVTSPKSFFYNQDLRANVISLTAANITLGTGLAYLLQGSQQNGLLMLLIPIMVWLGYYMLAVFVSRFGSSDIYKNKNFITGINEQISRFTSKTSIFSLLVTITLIIVYVIILPFEIFASSKILGPLLFSQNSGNSEIILSLIIYFAALLYVIFGGIGAVFATDKIQLTAILLFIPTLAFFAFNSSNDAGLSIPHISSVLKLSTPVVINIIAACIAAISTQFYSLLNWGYISHLETINQKRLLKKVGLFAGLLLLMITAIGVFYPIKENGNIITNLMSSYANLGAKSGFLVWLISGISVLGMTSIIFSTVDSLMIKIIMFYYDNVMKRDSRSEKTNPKELKYIRILVFICFLLVFILLGYFNFMQPNIFYLLLAIAAGVTVFAPMLVTAGYLSSKGNAIKIINNKVVLGYFILFLLAGISGISVFFLKPVILGWIGTIAFIISSVYSISLILIAKHHQASKGNPF